MMFCDVLRMFCKCSVSVLQYFHKTNTQNTHEKHRKTLEITKNSHYAREKTFAKHRKTLAKHSQNSHKTKFAKYCRKTEKTHAKRAKRHKTLTITVYSRNTYCAHSFFFP